MKKSSNRLGWFTAFGTISLIASGCGGGAPPTPAAVATPTPEATAAAPSAADQVDFTKFAEAGVPVQQTPNPKMVLADINQATAKYGPPRPDPFALKTAERQYELDQTSERVFGEIGGFQNRFNPKSPFDNAPPAIPEPQPYRRLAGVVVGDSILALIDMGNGGTLVIYPGEQLPAPDGQWTVKSIDLDKAVLERKVGNPREVTVRLELPPAGGAATPGFGGAPGFGGGGNPMGGAPPPGQGGGPPGFGQKGDD